MNTKITLCGDNCIECPRFNAHSDEELKKVAELWYKIGLRNTVVPNEEMCCSGCSPDKQCTYHLTECTKEHHVEKCNQCSQFPCQKVTDMLGRVKTLQTKCEKLCTKQEYEALEKAFFYKDRYLLDKDVIMTKLIDMDDIPSCVEVIKKSFATVANEFGFTEENAARFTAFATTTERLNWQLSNEHRPMYAYCEGDTIIGYYSLLLQDHKECELNNLCVLPAYRHQRIGGLLLEDAFAKAKKMNCKKINIGIVEENVTLRKWYEHYGFVHTGTQKFDFFPFTCGYMSKDLA